MALPRSSGILLHPTSLPGPWGIGDLGPGAYRFADFLAEAGQSWWQTLPLGPTGYGNSPYMCFSSIAGNPYLVSPEFLLEQGCLAPEDLEGSPSFPTERVHYASVIEFKLSLLAKSFKRFQSLPLHTKRRAFKVFCDENAFWLKDYALFMALKETHGGRTWVDWDTDIAKRKPSALKKWSALFQDAIEFQKYLQFLFFEQWDALKQYCHDRGIGIIGDMPIYVAHDSSEVWAHPELFRLDARGNPTVIAGVPPDYFSATGQRWGNPIYRWDVMAHRRYQWWITRFRANFSFFDLLRIDHFRGFEAYWEIPACESVATHGRWVKGPGASLFSAVRSALGNLPVIAEDLGVITPKVERLRDRFGFPGMRILQMAFGSDPKAQDYLPHNYIKNCVVYTATHDHNTTIGWLMAEPGKETTQKKEEIDLERDHALKYLDSDGSEIHWDMIRLAMASVANLAIFPLQDVLGLGSDCRMNRPGTATGNWEWRFTSETLSPSVKEKLIGLTRLYERYPSSNWGPSIQGTAKKPASKKSLSRGRVGRAP